MRKVLNVLLLAAVLLCARGAAAGDISFHLSLTGAEVIVTNQGNSTAFYPAVFKLAADGRWEQLAAKARPAELVPGARLQLTWTEADKTKQDLPLERMQAVMVCFFDQAGVGFGQISFFRAPSAAKEFLKSGYAGGKLFIEPPGRTSTIRSSWVLWPREEGIGLIRRPVRFEHRPPPATRIDWRSLPPEAFRLDTGAGQPAAILVHETDQGLFMQHVPSGGLQGREQRAAWLDARSYFYRAAQFAFGAGAALVVLQLVLRRLRRRPA
ncbi:MAG: hypothetical protein HY661_00090 [Betaproteobacteria bacterium]|nr:hypothetical protein [Betaproteobacteria bacterium]